MGPQMKLEMEKPTETLEEARKRVIENSTDTEGSTCPCCGKLVKTYRRKLHAEMARFLIKLHKKYSRWQRPFSMRELYPHANKATSDGSYLVHWGLVEKTDNPNQSGAPAGMYTLTDKGLRFVHGQEFVPSHVHLLNNKVVGWSHQTISIYDSLGEKFNYQELMEE